MTPVSPIRGGGSLLIIREIFKGDHNAAARKLRRKQLSALSGTLNKGHSKEYVCIAEFFSFGTTGLTTYGSHWSIRKFISPICKQETVPVQSDWLNSALSPVVYGDIAPSINT